MILWEIGKRVNEFEFENNCIAPGGCDGAAGSKLTFGTETETQVG